MSLPEENVFKIPFALPAWLLDNQDPPQDFDAAFSIPEGAYTNPFTGKRTNIRTYLSPPDSPPPHHSHHTLKCGHIIKTPSPTPCGPMCHEYGPFRGPMFVCVPCIREAVADGLCMLDKNGNVPHDMGVAEAIVYEEIHNAIKMGAVLVANDGKSPCGVLLACGVGEEEQQNQQHEENVDEMVEMISSVSMDGDRIEGIDIDFRFMSL